MPAKPEISILVRATDKVSKVMDAIQSRVDRFTLKQSLLQFVALGRAALLPNIAERFGTIATQAGILGKQVRTLATRMTLLGGIAGGSLIAITKSFTELGDNAVKTADKLGLPIESLQAWRFAAERANVPMEAFDGSLQALSKRMGEFAVTGAGKAAPAFEALGLSADLLEGKINTLGGVFPLILDRLNKIKDVQIRNAIAARLFGDEGIKLVNLASEGSQGLALLEKRARQLGLVISEKTARNTEIFADQMTDLGFAFSGVRNIVGEKLLPVFSELTVKLTSFITSHRLDITRWAEKLASIIKQLPGFLKNLNLEFQRLRETLQPLTHLIAKVVEHFGLLNTAVAVFGAVTLGPLILTLGRLSLAFISLFGSISKVALLFIRILPSGLAALIPLLTRLSILLIPLIGIFATLAAPLIILAAKVAVVVGALYGLHLAARKVGEMLSNWEPFQSIINNIAIFIATAKPLEKIFEGIKNGIGTVQDALGSGIQKLREFGNFDFSGMLNGLGGRLADFTGVGTARLGEPDHRTTTLQKSINGEKNRDSQTKVTIDFKNLPRGTRLSSDSQGPVELFLNPGYSL